MKKSNSFIISLAGLGALLILGLVKSIDLSMAITIVDEIVPHIEASRINRGLNPDGTVPVPPEPTP